MKTIDGPEFRKRILDRLTNRGRENFTKVLPSVKKIIKDIRTNGDQALLAYSKMFDKTSLTKSRLKISNMEIQKAYEKIDSKHIRAIEKAARNIERFHRYQLRDYSFQTLQGVTVGQVVKPLSSIGIYTPSGIHGYPSSLLMCAVPAKIAGVEKIIVCTPPNKEGTTNLTTLIAADVAGVTEVYRVGGVQAIAAMAYGTETIPKVDKIVGPGNIYVATAKQEVSTDVAVDLPAGPSEIVIIADETAKPSFIASDILAQAEHGPTSLVILLTTSQDLSRRVNEEIDKQRNLLSRREVINSSIQSNGFIVIVKNIEEAIENANLIAPEHLHIQVKSPRRVFNLIQNAGAIFLGNYSPVAFGDYSAGLNHVLPTGGYSRTYSGLSINDFVKRINFLECNRNGFLQLRDLTIALAEIEGFDGHARSVSIRD